MATHDSDISIDITLGPAPSPSAGYRLLILVPLATNSLDGDAFRAYATIEQAQADATATEIATTTRDRVIVALSQSPRPDLVYVASVDLAGGTPETYQAALARMEGVLGDNFFGVVIESRDEAIVAAVGAAVETAGRRLFALVSSAADFLAGDVPSGLSSIEGNDRSAAVYHDVATAYPDVAFLARLLATDPAILSARGPGTMAGTAVLSTDITEAQRLLLTTIANVGQPFGTSPNYLSPGIALSGRPVSELVTLEWVRRTLKALIIAQSLQLAPAKWPIASRGVALLETILGTVAEQGIAAQHFVPGEVTYKVFAPTSADRAAFRLRGEFKAQVLGHAIKFTVSGLLDRDPIVEA